MPSFFTPPPRIKLKPPRPPGLKACRLSGFCPPYPPLLSLFSKVSRTSPKVARFAASGRLWVIFNRTDLRKAASGAKFDAESDFEVRLAVVPPKSIKNDEKLISKTETRFRLRNA